MIFQQVIEDKPIFSTCFNPVEILLHTEGRDFLYVILCHVVIIYTKFQFDTSFFQPNAIFDLTFLC